MNIAQHLENLVSVAAKDLSEAHIIQHTYSADLNKQHFGLDVAGPGAHSVWKPTDQLQFDDNCVTGQKQWISYLPRVNWTVLTVKQQDIEQVILVRLDNTTKIELIPLQGMENTLTGHLSLDHTPYQVLGEANDPEYFIIRRQHALAFVAIHFGLARALFHDLDQHTQDRGIDCRYHLQKLKLQLDVMQLLWDQIPKQVSHDHRSHYFWQQKNTAYAFGKKCLLEVTQFATEIAGSGIYMSQHQSHQRYKDALIYCSHMKNLYYSMQES